MADIEKQKEQYLESNQKVDYFMTGLCVAIFAYSVQSFDAGNYVNYIFLAPIAWSLLLLAVLAGIVRLEYTSNWLGIGYKILLLDKRLNGSKIASQIVKHGTFINSQTKQPLTEQEILSLIRNIQSSEEYRKNLIKQEDKSIKIAEWAYRFRQWLLVFGLFILGLLKTLNL